MAFRPKLRAISSLKPHPRNYRDHPSDQLDEIEESLSVYGFYKNIVVSQDGYILTGHGVVLTAARMGLEKIPTKEVPIDHDHPKALKLLAGDNELSHLAMDDDRVLTELLKEIHETDETGLKGTGYDEQRLAMLLMVTRPASEIADFDAAAEWVGMPEFESGTTAKVQLKMNFASEEDYSAFKKLVGLPPEWENRFAWYPHREFEDTASIIFEESKSNEVTNE